MLRKITWSKHGVIACVTSSGKGVNTHVLIRNQKTNVWNLSKPVPLPLDLDESANKIVHISWSWLGNDLAIIDSSGRVFIFTTPGILGRLTLTRPGLSDLDIELNAVIGTYWMPIAPYVQKVGFLCLL
jgi:mediator of RNA polymerase II transcription subunit 16